MDEREATAIADVKAGRVRLVHAQRARKLRKRGVRVWWHSVFYCYAWSPGEARS